MATNQIDMLRETGIRPPEPDSIGVKVAVALTEPFEQFYGAVGARQPWQRLALGFALGSIGMWLVEPRLSFDENGKPRPFKLVQNTRDSTLVHWSIPPLLFGLASAVFI
jgi:hypothetical protein